MPTNPVQVAEKMEATRAYLKQLWGEDRYRRTINPLVVALRKIAEKTHRDPFQVAIDEATRAGRDHKEGIAWKLTAAACEIAETSARGTL